MKVAVLTSSRADYGVYLPLLKAMQNDPFFDLRLLVFGTHLSSMHGYTVDAIIRDGFTIDHMIEHMPDGDSAEAVATSMATASSKFVGVWQKEKDNYDLIICIGDRFEMFAAVSVTPPFNLTLAHIHGGETTLGAIDNEFRHCLTIFSSLHFVATDVYAQRVRDIKGNGSHIYTVGALSLDNLNDLPLFTVQEFYEKFQIDLQRPSILITYHPQTAGSEQNEENAQELVKALDSLKDFQLIITMPNADTMGNTMRKVYERFAKDNTNVILVESFGTQGYFSCMKHSTLVVGNSSSGIIEAASFGKYVVNVGDRQKGRATSENVINSFPDAASILTACEQALKKGDYAGSNIYFKGNAASAIIAALKKWKN